MQPLTGKFEVIRFFTYDSDWDQGYHYHLGDKEVWVETVRTTVTHRKNCASQELVEEEVDTITLDDRTFIPEFTTFWQEGMPKRSVALPYGFRPSLLFPRPCPYCGK